MTEKKWAVVSLFIAAVLVFTCCGLILSMDEAVGENPIRGINEKRSQVLVTGAHYTLNDKQEEEYKEQQKKQEEQIKEQQKKDADSIEEEKESASEEETADKEGLSPDGMTIEGGGGEQTEPSEPDIPEEEGTEETPDGDDGISKTPTIITNLGGIQRIEGIRLVFNLEGKDYKGHRIESFYFQVYVNGVRIYSAGEDTYQRTYRTDLMDGENEIIIKITDKEGNEASNVYTVYCDPEGEPAVGGSIHLIVDLRVLGLGYALDTEVEFYEGDNVAHVLERGLAENGFGTVTDGSHYYGWYLEKITMPGITQGWNIPEPIQEQLELYGSTEQLYDTDSLGAGDFYKNSGWMYMQNGETPQVGMASKDAQDGDEIYIYFTLESGFEFDGTWFHGDW